ncbi:transposable element Tcb1 transposase [Trichonephila clavipes]|nr:transposable element Tcb1 transposase [Trichonephila clavipes]
MPLKTHHVQKSVNALFSPVGEVSKRGDGDSSLIALVLFYVSTCTTSREVRQLCARAVTNRSVTSRTMAQNIESVMHHSVSARTIRHRLQQSGLSARRPLLGLHLTQNHIRFRRRWCNERSMWAAEWNEVVFTDESRIYLLRNDGRIPDWRHRGERMLNSCVMHR